MWWGIAKGAEGLAMGLGWGLLFTAIAGLAIWNLIAWLAG